MFVCLCNGINDAEVERVVTGGARSVREVALACGAGTVCGGCIPTVSELIERFSSEQDRGGRDDVTRSVNEP